MGISGKARGSQKVKTRDADDMSMTNMSGDYFEFNGELFLNLVSGNLLSKAWEDSYRSFGSAIAPKEWIEYMDKTAPSYFTNVYMAKERMTQF